MAKSTHSGPFANLGGEQRLLYPRRRANRAWWWYLLSSAAIVAACHGRPRLRGYMEGPMGSPLHTKLCIILFFPATTLMRLLLPNYTGDPVQAVHMATIPKTTASSASSPHLTDTYPLSPSIQWQRTNTHPPKPIGLSHTHTVAADALLFAKLPDHSVRSQLALGRSMPTQPKHMK